MASPAVAGIGALILQDALTNMNSSAAEHFPFRRVWTPMYPEALIALHVQPALAGPVAQAAALVGGGEAAGGARGEGCELAGRGHRPVHPISFGGKRIETCAARGSAATDAPAEFYPDGFAPIAGSLG